MYVDPTVTTVMADVALVLAPVMGYVLIRVVFGFAPKVLGLFKKAAR